MSSSIVIMATTKPSSIEDLCIDRANLKILKLLSNYLYSCQLPPTSLSSTIHSIGYVYPPDPMHIRTPHEIECHSYQRHIY